MADERIIPCQNCGSEGRIYVRCIAYEPGCGHAHSWGERDEGECQVCEGTGGEIIETEPVEMEDLDSADTCHDCGAWINPMLYPCNERTCPVRKRHTDFGR